jgi:hypothetical protein
MPSRPSEARPHCSGRHAHGEVPLARMTILGMIDVCAGMAESVDARDLKSLGPKGLCGFESRSRYQLAPNMGGEGHASR